MRFTLISAVIFSVLLCSSASKLPSNFKRCSSKDLPCLKDAIQDALPKLKDGIKELGVLGMDPLFIPKITVGAGDIVNLVQNYDNSEVFGFSTSKVKDVVFDLNEGKFVLDLEGDMAEMNASYTVKGKLMVFDVYGNGKNMLRLERIKVKFTMDLETYTKNNHKFLKGSNPHLVLDCEHAMYQFNNLFDGNKQLGDNINKVLNDNWKEIYDELVPGYMSAFGLSFLNIINTLFSKIPIDELFLD